MAMVTSEQSTANKEYVRRLLRQRQPGLFAALELAVDLLGQELHRAETPRAIGASESACPVAPRCCQRRRTLPRSSRAISALPMTPKAVGASLQAGITRDFATADGGRTLVAALDQRQSAGLARTFVFLEPLLQLMGRMEKERDTETAARAARASSAAVCG